MLLPALLAATVAAAAHSGAGPSEVALAAEVAETLADFNARAHAPLPALSAAQVQALADGEVVTHVQRRADGRYRVVGLGRSAAPKEAVWLAARDPHYLDAEAYEAALDATPSAETLYQRLALPGPFADRHWVIDVWDNRALVAGSGGAFWERPWELRGDGLALVHAHLQAGRLEGLAVGDVEAAVETPVNEGAVAALDLPGGGSLYSYAIVTSTGGGIPDRVVAAFLRVRMEGRVEAVLDRADGEVQRHYVHGHAPVPGADGAMVARFP